MIMDETCQGQASPMPCPQCGSFNTDLQATGRKAGVVIGGGLGAILASGVNGAKAGAIGGAAIASVVGRRSPAPIVGGLIGALAGFLWGARLGYTIGHAIDGDLLRLHRCHSCGTEFSG